MVTDVLVIGGGLAGLRAAEVCASSRLDVTVLCNGQGSSPFIHGISVPLLKEDSVSLFFSDSLKSGHYHNDQRLLKVLCEESLSLLNEFELDKKDEKYDLLNALGSSVPRVAFINGNTGANVLRSIEKSAKYKKLKHTRAYQLIKKDGRVCGAKCYDIEKKIHFTISCKGVILACGGFGGIFPFSTNSKDISGDGIGMAYDVGAILKDLDFIQFEPSVAVHPKELIGKSIITTMLYEGAVIKNRNGERFMNERQNKDSLSLEIYHEIKKGRGTEHGGVYYDMTNVDQKLLMNKYFNYYNRYKQLGIDISSTPVEIAPAPHTTMGGVQINERCETSIKGLFACGEVTGGLHGANRLGGNAGLEVLIFGKIAGKSCTEFAHSVDNPPCEDGKNMTDDFFDVTAINEKIRSIAYYNLNVVRNIQSMQQAVAECDELFQELNGIKKKNSFNAISAKNNLVTLKLALESSLLRDYNVGVCKIEGLEEFDASVRRGYSICVQQSNGTPHFEKELL